MAISIDPQPSPATFRLKALRDEAMRLGASPCEIYKARTDRLIPLVALLASGVTLPKSLTETVSDAIEGIVLAGWEVRPRDADEAKD